MLVFLAMVGLPDGQVFAAQEANGENQDDGASINDSNAFDVGHVWSGVLTQLGEHPDFNVLPNRYSTLLKVTRRDGDHFEGRLIEKTGGIQMVYVVAGDVIEQPDRDRTRIRFQSTKVESRSGTLQTVTGIYYAGCIMDGKLIGLWKHKRNQKGITMRGTFSLHRDAELEKDPPSTRSPLIPRLHLLDKRIR